MALDLDKFYKSGLLEPLRSHWNKDCKLIPSGFHFCWKKCQKQLVKILKCVVNPTRINFAEKTVNFWFVIWKNPPKIKKGTKTDRLKCLSFRSGRHNTPWLLCHWWTIILVCRPKKNMLYKMCKKSMRSTNLFFFLSTRVFLRICSYYVSQCQIFCKMLINAC